MTIKPRPFTFADAERAYDEWGANCGPGAVAAIMGMTLDAVRPIMAAEGFEAKHYTNPSMMNAVLQRIGRPWRKIGADWPQWGLVRVQWEGPWTKPGVPMRARYRYTHWVGSARGAGDWGIFDINCMNNGTGWCSLANWRGIVVPYILQQYPRASGTWHVTHAIEVEPVGKVTRTVLSFPGDPDLELTAAE
jgi:hypothetical protein